MISKYNSFKENLILEGIINESFIYFSEPLKRVLSKIDNPISDKLQAIHADDVKPDITFVDIDKEGYLSFITSKNAAKILTKQWKSTPEDAWFQGVLNNYDLDQIWKVHIDGKENDVYKKSRNSIKIGRVINKLFPGQFKDKDVEQFVNQFKATIENSKETFEIVEGEDIEHWYQSKNYAKNSGTLGNSCMAERRGIFGIYVKNPEVCKMLILREGDKILGRALIWKLKSIKHLGKDLEGVEYFMDRQYTINDSDVVKFRNYAKQQEGWVSKAYNNHHSFETIIQHNENDREIRVGMTVQLKEVSKNDYDYKSYPYVDTFRRYDVSSGILHNDDDNESRNEGDYLLQDTHGSYERIEGGYWSEYYDRMIPEDEAVYSDWVESYIWAESSVRVDIGQRRYHGYYPEDHDDVVFCENRDDYANIEDAIYSDYHMIWLFKDDAVKAVTEIDSDGEVYSYRSSDDWFDENDNEIVEIDINLHWFEFLSNRFDAWDDWEYILKDLMTTDLNGDYIPSEFSIEVYEVLEANKEDAIDISGIEYLTKVDAEILGYNIDDKGRLLDQFHYHNDLDPILEKLYVRLSNMWVSANNQLEDKGQLRIKFKDFKEDEYLTDLAQKANRYLERLEELEKDKYCDLDDRITITRLDT